MLVLAPVQSPSGKIQGKQTDHLRVARIILRELQPTDGEPTTGGDPGDEPPMPGIFSYADALLMASDGIATSMSFFLVTTMRLSS